MDVPLYEKRVQNMMFTEDMGKPKLYSTSTSTSIL